VIISTFTYVQAPFSVHADVSVGESAMRDSARFHSASSCPMSRISARRPQSRRWRCQGRFALVSAISSRTPWWYELEADGAPKSSRGCRSSDRADHPAALSVFVISRVADDAMDTDVQTWSVHVSGWNATPPARWRRSPSRRRTRCRLRRPRRLLVSVAGTGSRKSRWPCSRRGSVRVDGPRRQPCKALYGAADRDSPLAYPANSGVGR